MRSPQGFLQPPANAAHEDSSPAKPAERMLAPFPLERVSGRAPGVIEAFKKANDFSNCKILFRSDLTCPQASDS